MRGKGDSALAFAGQIHRFGNAVAVYVRGADGATAYVTPDEARDMARALLRAARCVEAESFVASTFAPWSRERSHDARDGVRIEREGRVVARSQNLRGFYSYARKLARAGDGLAWGTVRMVGVYRYTGRGSWRARVVVTFADGASGESPFMSRELALAWGERFATRRGGAFVQDS